jgi:hypothetical protein
MGQIEQELQRQYERMLKEKEENMERQLKVRKEGGARGGRGGRRGREGRGGGGRSRPGLNKWCAVCVYMCVLL